MFATQTTPSDDELMAAVQEHRTHLTSNKILLQALKKAHPEWIVGRKRVGLLANLARENEAAENSMTANMAREQQSLLWQAKVSTLDSPVSTRNIIKPVQRVSAARAVASTNWAIGTHATSPSGSEGGDNDSDWEAPERLFIRPGSGLKPTTPSSLHRQRYDSEDDIEVLTANKLDEKYENHIVLKPRSITFVPEAFLPDSKEEPAEEDIVDAEHEAEVDAKLKQDTLTKMKIFFERNQNVTPNTKARVVKKLQGFFNRPKEEEPLLPLARIETQTVTLTEAASDSDFVPGIPADAEDNQCSICTVM